MESRQGNMLQSLRAVEDFLAANADTLGGIVDTGARRRLTTLIAALEHTVAEQAAAAIMAQGGTRRYRVLRRALMRDHMAPIARMARADLSPTPEMDALRMPRTNWSAERVAAAAHGMATAAEPFRAEFVEAGLPRDFIERLTAAADDMVQSLSDRTQERGRRSGATRGLQRALASGRKLVAVIDALIASGVAHDPALLANWRLVKRVRHAAEGAAHPMAAGASSEPPQPPSTFSGTPRSG